MQQVWHSKIVHLPKEDKKQTIPLDTLIKDLIHPSEHHNHLPKNHPFQIQIQSENLEAFNPFAHLVITSEQARIRRAILQQKQEILWLRGPRGSGLSMGLCLSLCEQLKESKSKMIFISPNASFYQKIFDAQLQPHTQATNEANSSQMVQCYTWEDFFKTLTQTDYVDPPSIAEIKKFVQKHINLISKPILEIFQSIDRFVYLFAYFFNQVLYEIDGFDLKNPQKIKDLHLSLRHFDLFDEIHLQSLAPKSENLILEQCRKLLEAIFKEGVFFDHLQALDQLSKEHTSMAQFKEIRYLVIDEINQFNLSEIKAFFYQMVKKFSVNENRWQLIFSGEEGAIKREQSLNWQKMKQVSAIQFDRPINELKIEQNEKYLSPYVRQILNPLVSLYEKLPFKLRPQISRLNTYLQAHYKNQQQLIALPTEISTKLYHEYQSQLKHAHQAYFFHEVTLHIDQQSYELKKLIYTLLASQQIALIDFDGKLIDQIKYLIKTDLAPLFSKLNLSIDDLNIFRWKELIFCHRNFSILMIYGDLLDEGDLKALDDVAQDSPHFNINHTINQGYFKLMIDRLRFLLTQSNRGIIRLSNQSLYLTDQIKKPKQDDYLQSLLAKIDLKLTEMPLDDCLALIAKHHFYQGYEFFVLFEEAQQFQQQELWLSARQAWVKIRKIAKNLLGDQGDLLCKTALEEIQGQALEVAIGAQDWRSTKELLIGQKLPHALKVSLNAQVKKQADQMLQHLESKEWGRFDRDLELTTDLDTLDISAEANHHICEALWKCSQKISNELEHFGRQSKIFEKLSKLKSSKGYEFLTQGYEQQFDLQHIGPIAKITLAYLQYCSDNAQKTSKGTFVKGTLNHPKTWLKVLDSAFTEHYQKSDALFCMRFAVLLLEQKEISLAKMMKNWAESLATSEGLAIQESSEFLAFTKIEEKQPFDDLVRDLREKGDLQGVVKLYQKQQEQLPPEISWLIEFQQQVQYAKSTVGRLTVKEKDGLLEMARKLLEDLS